VITGALTVNKKMWRKFNAISFQSCSIGDLQQSQSVDNVNHWQKGNPLLVHYYYYYNEYVHLRSRILSS
jgi:hypothetical protein